MEITFSVLLVCYLIFLVFIRLRWDKIQEFPVPDMKDGPGVSLVVPARNEQANIDRLMESINRITYPKHKIEIVVVDDASQDETLARLRQWELKQSNLKSVSLSAASDFQGSFKKRALTKGIEAATNPIIVTTDADCQFNPLWVDALVEAMEKNQWTFVSGPVVYSTEENQFPFLNMELACLVAVGAVSLKLGNPNMCNGANLAFTKKAFLEVGGYQGYEHIVSGDDEFLLHKMSHRYPGNIGFLKTRVGIVTTDPPSSWKSLFNQRKRWASKWNAHRSVSTRLMAIAIFCFHLFFAVVFLMTLIGSYSWKLFLGQVVTKMLFEYLLITSVLRFLGKRIIWKWFFLWQMLYSFYAVFVGIAAKMGGFRWKNRQY